MIKILTIDSEEVSSDAIIERVKPTTENMRSMMVQLTSDLYERLQDFRKEAGEQDFSKIMSEIPALGLIHYKRNQRKYGQV